MLLTYGYIRYAWYKNWLDKPNERSSHILVVPRGVGAVFIGLWWFISFVLLYFHAWTLQAAMVLLPGSTLIATVAFYDDRVGLSAKYRMLFYFFAAIISIVALNGFQQLLLTPHHVISLGYIGSIIAVLALLWSTNLFNFMDGLDGIAAIEALFTLGVGGFFLSQSGGQSLAKISWILAACMLGFLVWNKPPAKIFMGDVGSATLGFIIMGLALLGEKQYQVPIMLWLILYGAFLVDATLTLIRRAIAKEAIFQAHRLHAYQRLHQAGFSHTKVLMWMIFVNILLATLAITGFYHMNYLPLFALTSLILLIGCYLWIEHMKPMYLCIKG